jgi:tagatose 1,6-diphosphate aldolase
VVERVGAECASAGLPFLLEPVTPSPDAKQRPRDILRAVQEFSQPHYQVDVLKIELPIRPRRVGLDYSRAQAQEVLQQIATTTQLPVVFLSGGVPFDELQEGLEFAADSAARFHGVLCGRSLWSGGIPVFAQQGAGGLKEWLACEALPNLQRLQRLVDTRASAVPIGLQPGLGPADATSAQKT